MIMMFQLAFLSFLDVGELNPTFSALQILKLTMGYSLFSSNDAVSDDNSPF